MDRKTSSSNAQTKKFQSQQKPPEKKVKGEKLQVNPLRGLSNRSSSSSSSSNASGSGSISSENCHRFLLSQSSSSSLGKPVKSVAKTPKSAPVVVKPLTRKKPRSLEEIKLKSQRCNINPRTTGKITMKQEKVSILKKQSAVSREVKLKDSQISIRVDDSIALITPVTKLGIGSDLIHRSNGEATDDGRLSSSYQEKTPPVQASVSPEMQYALSMSMSASSQSQACYAAGHLLSGVSDKRKCKPKGLLTVGENGFEVSKGKILDSFDEGDFGNDGSCDNIEMPLPADASVHWLLSPCDEEKEHEKEKSDDGFSKLQQIVETPSPLLDRSASSDLCNISSGRSLSSMDISNEKQRRTSSSLSPNELSRFRRFLHLSSIDGEASESNKGEKLSPLSVDTLESENVIQTPESDSSFDNYFGLSCSQAEIQKKHDVASDLESLTMTLQRASLSPRSHASSFNFESLGTSSNTIDLSQFQRTLLDKSSCHTHVVLDKVSRKHGRRSWREEANSHKEGDAPLGKGREVLPYSAAESISTDGGGLISSEDSNWMACYKN